MGKPAYREPDPASGSPEGSRSAALFPWSMVLPLGLIVAAGLVRSLAAIHRREAWGAEPSLALLMAVVSACLVGGEVSAWRRHRGRPERGE